MAYQSREEFITEKENQYKGTMQFTVMAYYLGGSILLAKPLSGLLYKVGNTIVFEDFEKENTLFGMARPQSGTRQKFVKTVIEIDANILCNIQRIFHSDIGRLKNSENPLQFKTKKPFFSFLQNKIDLLVQNDSIYYLFDTLDSSKADYSVI